MLQRVRILVASKQHIWIFQKLLANLIDIRESKATFKNKYHVANGVVLLVDGEDRCIGHLSLQNLGRLNNI